MDEISHGRLRWRLMLRKVRNHLQYRVPWHSIGGRMHRSAGFLGKTVAFPLRLLGRFLPIVGLAAVLGMFFGGSALLRYAQQQPLLQDAPYVVGAVLGFLLWPPIVWYVTNFRAKEATVADSLGLIMLASVVGLPWLGAGALSAANLAFDESTPRKSTTTIREVFPAIEGKATRKIVLRREPKSDAVEVEVDPTRFPKLEAGLPVDWTTGEGFFGWEYHLAVQPAAGSP